MYKPFGLNTMKKITLTKDKIQLEDDIEEISEGEVKKIGNGGMILSSKKYIGKRAYVIIIKE